MASGAQARSICQTLGASSRKSAFVVCKSVKTTPPEGDVAFWWEMSPQIRAFVVIPQKRKVFVVQVLHFSWIFSTISSP